mgnify:CR=1 FL=1
MFNAILLNKNEDGSTAAQVTSLDDAQLPADGDVTVAIDYSTINYKDGLAITGKGESSERTLSVPPAAVAAVLAWIECRGTHPGALFNPLDRPRQRLRVHVTQHQHLAASGVGGDHRYQSLGVEPRCERRSFFHLLDAEAHRIGGQVHGVRAHVRDQTDRLAAAQIDAFVQALRDLHRPRG